jgi:preprotein translocase subunit SecF
MRPLRLVPDNTRIDFLRYRIPAFIFSALLILASFATVAVNGLNFGIDFRGGILIEIRTEQPADIAQLRSDLGGLGLGEVALQEFGAPTDLLIRLQQQEGGEAAQQAAIEKVRTALGEDVTYRRIEQVGPQVGAELIEAGTLAVLLAIAGILLYVWFRFEWQFGLAAIAALSHDVITTLGLYSVTGMEFSLSSVAAVLTIAGYSINDTVVIFDRVREDMRKYKTRDFPSLLNDAINQTLARTSITSGTTLLAALALMFFGGEVIRGFSVALVWGLVIGTYSSILVGVPLLLYFDMRRNEQKSEVGAAAETT